MRGIIYCIKQKETGYDSPIYIGSTSNFNNRLRAYNNNFRLNTKECKTKLYKYINNNGGWDNFDMIEIGVIEYENKCQLKIEEQKWIDDLGATLNTYDAVVNLDKKKERDRENSKRTYYKHKTTKQNYYKINKKKILENAKIYYQQKKKNLNKDLN